MSLLRKINTDGAALMSYGRQFHIAGAAQRKACDQAFLRDEHGSSYLLSAEDVSARRKILLVIGISDMLVTGLQEFIRQSGDLIVNALLDRKPMKLLQSLGDADACPLTCDNTSERALQTLKLRNVLNRDSYEGRVGLIDETADERTANISYFASRGSCLSHQMHYYYYYIIVILFYFVFSGFFLTPASTKPAG